MVNITKVPSPFSVAIIRLLSSTSYSSFSTLCRKIPSLNLPAAQTPPVAKKVPFKVSAHGREWQDPYHWMSNIHDPKFIDYVNLENSYAEGFMADTMRLREKLFGEMRQRMPVKTETPPERWGQWLYSQFIPEGKEYPILCRRLKARKSGWIESVVDFVSGGDKETVLLDWNELAEKYGYVHVGTCRVSPDHNYLAYTLDSRGDERFVLFIKDLRDGSILSASGVDGVVSLAWVQDGDSLYLYYTLSDASQRPYRVLRRKIGSDADCFEDVYTENDTNFCVDVANTKDGKFVTVNSNSRTSSEVYVIDASKPKDGLRRVHKRISNVQYFLEHHNGYFYVLTNAPIRENLPCENYYLGICKVEDSESATWQNIILPSEGTSIHDMDISNGHLVLFLRKHEIALTCSVSIPINLTVKRHQLTLDSVDPWYFPMPANMCTVVPGSNNDFMSSVYRLVLSSPVMPDVIVDYDMTSKEFHIVKQDEVMEAAKISGTSSSDSDVNTPHSDNKITEESTVPTITDHQWRNFSSSYSCETREVASHDGVRVPLTILYSKDAWNKGCSPGLLYGYGAYGEDLDKSWCSDRLSLLDRGWVLAFADVRGGGGDDSTWHKSGSGLQKLNSLHDFMSCAEYLINEKVVHVEKLSAVGHSAGGLLVASVINKRPELFGAAILKVPFLDICNTLLDSSLPLTILDYEEFGNPEIKSEFESILSYSPYENLPGNICYPPTLVLASLNDSRVGVWEAAKWVAKVRDITCSKCSPSVILKTNMVGGHFSEGGRFTHCHETAYEYAFLLKAFGSSGEGWNT